MAPLAPRAQQQLDERMRRVGVLTPYRENDLGAKGSLSGFTQGLQGLGWTDGRNVQVDVRWATTNNGMRMVAQNLGDPHSKIPRFGSFRLQTTFPTGRR
jgi:hypothetical protein